MKQMKWNEQNKEKPLLQMKRERLRERERERERAGEGAPEDRSFSQEGLLAYPTNTSDSPIRGDFYLPLAQVRQTFPEFFGGRVT